MFGVKLIITKFGYDNKVEKLIGYTEDENIAKEYCIKETAKLVYDRSRGVVYYNYYPLHEIKEGCYDDISAQESITSIDDIIDNMNVAELFNLLNN